MAKYSYKDYTFEVDHTPTPEEFQQMQNHVDSLPPKQKSLVDQIPGLAPKVKQPPEDTSPLGVLSHIGNSLGSGLETIASVGSGLTSGMAGSLLGGWT